MVRYGQVFPDRVLQTIASSPQDVNYIPAVNSTATCNSPLGMTSPSTISPSCHVVDHSDSDSGCSATDDELCDITNKMAATADSSRPTDFHAHKTSPCCTSSNCNCSCSGDVEVMFTMDSHKDIDLDIDMIENN